MTYKTFRRVLAAVRLRDATYFPASKYAQVFIGIGEDKNASGVVDFSKLGPMLFALGFRKTPEDLVALREEMDDRGDGTLLFGDFCDIASRDHNVRLEFDILKKLEDKAEKLKKLIGTAVKFIILFIPATILLFCFHLFNLAIE